MDPSFWQLPTDPPPLYEEKDHLAIEGPEEGPPEKEEEEEEEYGGEEDLKEANTILDELELPNYDNVEMRLNEPEMTATKQKNYLRKVIRDAETRGRQAVALKSNATKKHLKLVKSLKKKET